MFTGIVDRLGRVVRVVRETHDAVVEMQTGYSDLALGESVAMDGVCLTVAEGSAGEVARVFVSHETLARTALADWREGSVVNLERSAQLSTRLSGHLVQGHVDGVGEVERIEPRAGSTDVILALPSNLHRYCVEKGSLAVSGVSLTLNAVEAPDPDGRFRVRLTIIPHTWDATGFQALRPGSRVNVEADVVAKYVERLCQPYQTS